MFLGTEILAQRVGTCLACFGFPVLEFSLESKTYIADGALEMM